MPVSPGLPLSRCCLASDLKFVFHGENPRHLVGRHFRHGVVSLIVNEALQGHVSVINDDVNRAYCSHEVAIQSTLVVDRPRNLLSDPVVIGRSGQHSDLIVRLVDAFDTLHHVLRVLL